MKPKTHRWSKVANSGTESQDKFDLEGQKGKKNNKKRRKQKKLQWLTTKRQLEHMEVNDLRDYIAETEYD